MKKRGQQSLFLIQNGDMGLPGSTCPLILVRFQKTSFCWSAKNLLKVCKNRSLEHPGLARGTSTHGFRGSGVSGRRPTIKDIDESMIKTTRCKIWHGVGPFARWIYLFIRLFIYSLGLLSSCLLFLCILRRAPKELSSKVFLSRRHNALAAREWLETRTCQLGW